MTFPKFPTIQRSFLFLSAGLILLTNGKAAVPEKITATGSGAQAIQGGNVTLVSSVEA